MTLKEKFDAYVQQHIFEPKYASATITWNDTQMQEDAIFKLSADIADEDDESVFFHLNGYTELERLTGEDFSVDMESVEFFEKL